LDLQIGDTNSSIHYGITRHVISRVVNAFDMIFDETKISRKYLPKIELLIEVLKVILLDIYIEVTKHKDPYLSEEQVNKEHI
jgi:hypothetical protein